MKSSTFNYSLLAIGVAAVMGISTAVSAVETPTTTTGVDIINQATASYQVSGQNQPVAKSNIVKVTVSQQVSFSLTANNDDTAQGGTKDDDKNEREAVAPNGFVLFEHTLTNTGNLTDTYNITLGSTDGKYDQNSSTVNYTVYESDGITAVVDRTNITVAYTAGASIPSTLEKGQSVKFTIRAKTLGNKGNETLPLQLSVTSAYLASVAGATNTLINYNTSFTRLPSFGIVKTITNGLDLNNLNDTATYKVVVTNDRTDFGADATDIAIADILPNSLVMAKALTASNITFSNSSDTMANIDSSNAGGVGTKGFNITGVNLAVGQSITITFEVKQDGIVRITPEIAKDLINHVTITDDLDDNAATTGNTLIDSTKTGSPENVSTFYPTDDVNNLNGQTPANPGDDSTVPLLTIERKLTLTGPTIREIARTTALTSDDTAGQVTHQAIITNTGKDVEGSKPGELTFTIKDNDGTNNPDAINIVPGTVTVTYDPDGAGPLPAEAAQPIIAGAGGVYDINSVTTLKPGIKAGGTVTINYNVSANEAPMFSPGNSTTPTFEDTIVTLIPGLEGAPTVAPITDKTTVRGLVLVKKQAIAEDCAATSNGIVGTFVTTDIGGINDPTTTISPGQCIVYQIEAKNTSTADIGFNITDITILDEFSKFSANANYVTGSVTAVNGVAAATTTDVKTTVTTLAPQATASMTFKVQIKTKTGN